MIEKIKNIYQKYKEIILYLVFGVITTVVSLAACYATLKIGALFIGDDPSTAAEMMLDVAGSTVQWVSGVLVAFFTNKKWVFTDADQDISTARQLVVFAGGRVVTFFIDYVVTFFGALALSALLPSWRCVVLLGKELNINELSAKLVAAVIVVISNYFFSKFLVFKSKK